VFFSPTPVQAAYILLTEYLPPPSSEHTASTKGISMQPLGPSTGLPISTSGHPELRHAHDVDSGECALVVVPLFCAHCLC